MESLQLQNLRQNYLVTQKGTYLKNASIAGTHERVLAKMHQWQTSMAHEAGMNEGRFFDLLMDTKDIIARFIGASSEEVALTENSSHNMNILAMMMAKEKAQGKNKIILCEDEFPSCVLPFYYHGFEVEMIPTENGHFTAEHLFERVDDQTAAVVVSLVQFLTGMRMDERKLSDLAKDKGVPLILNSTQHLGAFPLDLSKLNVAALSSSCHKWLGASIGQSILYINKDFKRNRKYPLAGWCSVDEPFEMRNEPPILRQDVGALMLGSLPFAAIAGVAEACLVQEEIGRDLIAERVLELSAYLRNKLKERGYKPLGPKTPSEESGIVTFPLDLADDFVNRLMEKNIHVNQRRGKIRVSPHFYNSIEDLDIFLEALDKK